MQHEGFHFPHFHASACSLSREKADGFIAGHGQHVGILMGFQPGAQVQVAPIDAIGHRPRDGQLSLAKALQHLHGQFRFGLEARRLRNASLLAPFRVFCPVQGQIEFAVEERMAFGRDVGQKDADLTILDLAGRPTVLHLDTCRLAAPLGEAGLVNGDDGLMRAQLLEHIATQVVTHQIGIPDRTGEQTLHAIGSGFSGLFS
jgi:hypothetical protein